jgi:membrane protease YdiL (CAAX protease family)
VAAQTRDLKPLPLPSAILYFGIPALVLVFCVYYLIPYFMGQGYTEFISYGLALLIPLLFMLAASLIALRIEGYPINWETIKQRFRLRKMNKTDWIWTGISLVIMLIGAGIFGVLGQLLVTNGVIPLPSKIPTALLDPTVDPSNLMNVFLNALGPNVKGNWGLVLFTLILLFFNIVGEEFWWRGLILPRQELTHGRNTWLIHGTLWALFHAFKYWSVIGLLPVCLTLSYVAQRRQNTWPGIITHFIVNGLSLLPIIGVVLGN